jgi:hypothetical protein
MVRLLRKIRQSDGESERDNERDRGVGDEQDTPSGTTAVDAGNATDMAGPAVEADTDADERPVSLDQIYGTLSNHRRRRVLWKLMETERVELGDLAEQIAARELEKPRGQLTTQERKRLYVSLYQAHLPKLADVDAITYDKRQGLIKPGPAFDIFTGYLPDEPGAAFTETEERRWRDYLPDVRK